ncbi:MAG: fatty acid desaturase [Proteobacteria bacterium]|nr:fatty acid desaturase [Pseudomonadota bacterium]
MDGHLKARVADYQQSDPRASLQQLATSIGLFVLACALMYRALDISYALTLALSVPAAGFLVRIFIIQHDCGHGAFFKTRRLNDLVGAICSVMTLTPYRNWRRQHAGHHRSWNNLDLRLAGSDIYSTCLTVGEYRALTWRHRWLYRLTRHRAISNLVLPPLVFLLLYRVQFDTPKTWKRDRRSVYWTDLAIGAVGIALGLELGFRQVLLVQVPVMALASIIGVWLFSVQHRFEHALWARQPEWSTTSASLRGSSYLRLPKLLQWFSGNIGFHHVHHLNPRVPNYRLQECHDGIPELRATPILTLRSALLSPALALWDEDRQKLVSFADLRGHAF